ncbi:MAG TPA: hypothetical protein VG318_10815 [Actinomycetota bacterium]|nr:hypothetical protein [Actinomycetota bacterium]
MPVREEDVEFDPVDLSVLDPVCVVAQSLDNQWVPSGLLRRMMRRRRALDDVAATRTELVRAEYLRALVNARQVVVNRAFLYNNPAVFADYVAPGAGREAFEKLLSSGAIMPFLFGERSPVQAPPYTTNPAGFGAWSEVSQEVKMPCLRLSWDDRENLEYIRHQLVARFGDFAQGINRLDMAALLRDLGLSPDAGPALKERLTDISRRCVEWSGEDRDITRENLYREFVVADGTEPAEGKYDRDKPFAAEIKQLLDLNYNVNLPDALERFPLTPTETLHRTALQEWQKSRRENRELTPEELLELLRNAAFDLVAGGQYIKSLGGLSLREIVTIRSTWQWDRYTSAMEGLMNDPLAFHDPDHGAPAVYAAYVALAQEATKIAAEHKRERLAQRWLPGIELVVEVAGAVVSVLWGEQSVVKVAGEVSKKVGDHAAPVVVRLVVRGITELGSRADLATSIDFMTGEFDRAQTRWKELVSGLEKLPGYATAIEAVAAERPAANIDYSGELYT